MSFSDSNFLSHPKLDRDHKIVKNRLSKEENQTFEIIDSCRLDNQLILKLGNLEFKTENFPEQMATFVPAAGASSRYFSELNDLKKACLDGDSKNFFELAETFANDKGDLPAAFPDLLQTVFQKKIASSDELLEIVKLLEMPKAFQKSSDPSSNFFEEKIKEHEKIGSFCEQIFVISPDFKDDFEVLARSKKSTIPIFFVEQGADQSTCRFSKSGELLLNDGKPVMVPAGHGALLETLAELGTKRVRSVFIRNIDNLMSPTTEAIKETQRFLKFFSFLKNRLDAIRSFMARDEFQLANDQAIDIIQTLSLPQKNDIPPLEYLETYLFGVGKDGIHPRENSYFCRPLVVMGMVSNLNHDKGGAPVVAKVDGQVIKLCIEGPHVSEKDHQEYLAQSGTYFNPVFVAAELPREELFSSTLLDKFKILACKSYQGSTSLHVESILYELLGNSQSSNLAFVEISRQLFNPHKSFRDSKLKL